MENAFTEAQIAWVKAVVADVLAYRITRDEAQRLLTQGGIPVVKIDGYTLPKKPRLPKQTRRQRKKK